MARQTQFRFKREGPQSASIPHKFVISLSTSTNHGDDIDQLADPQIQKILPTLHTLGDFFRL
jgi:hypothetical protein